jgi:hypothetical protein
MLILVEDSAQPLVSSVFSWMIRFGSPVVGAGILARCLSL